MKFKKENLPSRDIIIVSLNCSTRIFCLTEIERMETKVNLNIVVKIMITYLSIYIHRSTRSRKILSFIYALVV